MPIFFSTATELSDGSCCCGPEPPGLDYSAGGPLEQPLVFSPCCPGMGLPQLLYLTIVDAGSGYDPSCACWEGMPIPLRFYPGGSPPYMFAFDSWASDYLPWCADGAGSIVLLLFCDQELGYWTLSVTGDLTGGPAAVDPGYSCDPVDFVFSGGGAGTGLQIDPGDGSGACLIQYAVVTRP